LEQDERGWSTPRTGDFTPGKTAPDRMVQEAGRTRAGIKSFAPTEARIPNLSVCSESLYPLCYSGPPVEDNMKTIITEEGCKDAK